MSCDYEYLSKKSCEEGKYHGHNSLRGKSQHRLSMLPEGGAYEPKTVGSLCRIAAVNARTDIKRRGSLTRPLGST